MKCLIVLVHFLPGAMPQPPVCLFMEVESAACYGGPEALDLMAARPDPGTQITQTWGGPIELGATVGIRVPAKDRANIEAQCYKASAVVAPTP